MKVIILAGGEAIRLRPLSCNTAKVMIPVLNRPFLEHLIGYFKKHNVVDIILALGKSPEQVQSYFGDGGRLGINISYSVENFPLGTAGAVKNAERLLDESFLVFNGDTFTDINLTSVISLHHQTKAIASIALTPVDDPTVYGVVETDAGNKVKRFVEKPKRGEVTTNRINAGIYVLEPEILDYITPNIFFTFERDVFPSLLERGKTIYGYGYHDYWIDIGTPDRYLKLQRDLLQRCVGGQGIEFEGESFVHPAAQIEGPALIGEGCSIGKNSLVKGPVVLGPKCRIEEGAVLEGAVLWRDCKVGGKAKLRNCLIASCCYIGEESEVLDDCVLGDNVRIGKGNKLSHGIKIWPNRTIESDAISL